MMSLYIQDGIAVSLAQDGIAVSLAQNGIAVSLAQDGIAVSLAQYGIAFPAHLLVANGLHLLTLSDSTSLNYQTYIVPTCHKCQFVDHALPHPPFTLRRNNSVCITFSIVAGQWRHLSETSPLKRAGQQYQTVMTTKKSEINSIKTCHYNKSEINKYQKSHDNKGEINGIRKSHDNKVKSTVS
ncbi:hypothetical protein Btru_041439 [Bulinus truncatus]|nr:hypothetical protein Btru_041439 [Bulinus truncatus]